MSHLFDTFARDRVIACSSTPRPGHAASAIGATLCRLALRHPHRALPRDGMLIAQRRLRLPLPVAPHKCGTHGHGCGAAVNADSSPTWRQLLEPSGGDDHPPPSSFHGRGDVRPPPPPPRRQPGTYHHPTPPHQRGDGRTTTPPPLDPSSRAPAQHIELPLSKGKWTCHNHPPPLSDSRHYNLLMPSQRKEGKATQATLFGTPSSL